jgi:hypothetical protein
MGIGCGPVGGHGRGVGRDGPVEVVLDVCLRKRSGEYQYSLPSLGAGTPRAAGAVGSEDCRHRGAQGTFSVTKAPASVHRSMDAPFKS